MHNIDAVVLIPGVYLHLLFSVLLSLMQQVLLKWMFLITPWSTVVCNRFYQNGWYWWPRGQLVINSSMQQVLSKWMLLITHSQQLYATDVIKMDVTDAAVLIPGVCLHLLFSVLLSLISYVFHSFQCSCVNCWSRFASLWKMHTLTYWPRHALHTNWFSWV